MKKFAFLIITTLFLTISAFAGEVTLLKRTISITPQKFLRYWKNPKAAEPVYNTNSWYPKVNFTVLGPIAQGSKLYVEFDRANGTPWMKVDMFTPSLEDDVMQNIRPEPIDSSVEEKFASIEIGVIAFRIKLKNASGNETLLFSGKFRVNQLSLDQAITENKGKKEFMVDYDWHLPVSYLWLNPADDQNVPYLSTQVCFKGNIKSAGAEASLFYNGKEISKSSSSSFATSSLMTSGADEPHHRYSILQFNFANVRGFNKSESANNYSSNFFIDKNPGEYEIKVLREGQLARVIKFTVGKDGKIFDNNIAKNAKLGGVRFIIPAQIVGTLDGIYNKTAWQTEALFFNPLAGFAAQ